MAAVLEIDGLSLEFDTDRGPARVLDGVSLTVGRGETLGLVGESGCGKSVTGLAAMRLLPVPAARLTGGDIRLGGDSLLGLSEPAMRAVRGRRMAMIFQDPMVSLNPLMTIGAQLAETLRLHGLPGQTAGQIPGATPGQTAGATPGQTASATPGATPGAVAAALAAVGIGDGARAARAYPHQFSGGMRQRAMIAMMLACRPEVLIADEPTTALDVTVQAQVLDLIGALQAEIGMAVLLVTHNLGVVAESCDRVAVMYAGTVVESGPVGPLFARPRHPYTAALLAAIPRADVDSAGLAVIEGRVPDLVAPPAGCRFHPRCARASDLCRRLKPPAQAAGAGHQVACHHPEGLA